MPKLAEKGTHLNGIPPNPQEPSGPFKLLISLSDLILTIRLKGKNPRPFDRLFKLAQSLRDDEFRRGGSGGGVEDRTRFQEVAEKIFFVRRRFWGVRRLETEGGIRFDDRFVYGVLAELPRVDKVIDCEIVRRARNGEARGRGEVEIRVGDSRSTEAEEIWKLGEEGESK